MTLSRQEHATLSQVESGMPDSNCYCLRCKQPLTEIESHGQLLKGCVNCNIWWAMRGASRPRLSAAELRSLIKRKSEYVSCD